MDLTAILPANYLERGVFLRHGRVFGRDPVNKFLALVWLVTAMRETGKDPSPPKCRRCCEGPSFHGGHERGDPECHLHGCLATVPADIQFFLRAKAIVRPQGKMPSRKQRTAWPRGFLFWTKTLGSHRGYRTMSLYVSVASGDPPFTAHNRKAPNCVLYGAGGVTAPRVQEHLLTQELRQVREDTLPQMRMELPNQRAERPPSSPSHSQPSHTPPGR